MTKEELLLNIRESMVIAKQISNHTRQISSYNKSLKWFFLLSILSIISTCFIYKVIGLLDDLGFVVIIGVPGIIMNLAIIYLIVTKIFNPMFYKKKINAIRSDILLLLEQLDKKSLVPAYYIDYNILLILESYLINQRADTLKECINLYEQDKTNQLIIGRIEDAEAAAAFAQAEAASARRDASRLKSEVDDHRNRGY